MVDNSTFPVGRGPVGSQVGWKSLFLRSKTASYPHWITLTYSPSTSVHASPAPSPGASCVPRKGRVSLGSNSRTQHGSHMKALGPSGATARAAATAPSACRLIPDPPAHLTAGLGTDQAGTRCPVSVGGELSHVSPGPAIFTVVLDPAVRDRNVTVGRRRGRGVLIVTALLEESGGWGEML